MFNVRMINRGNPAPNFGGRGIVNSDFKFDAVGGHFILSAFLGTIADPQAAVALMLVRLSAHIMEN